MFCVPPCRYHMDSFRKSTFIPFWWYSQSPKILRTVIQFVCLIKLNYKLILTTSYIIAYLTIIKDPHHNMTWELDQVCLTPSLYCDWSSASVAVTWQTPVHHFPNITCQWSTCCRMVEFIVRGSQGVKKYQYPGCEVVPSVFETEKRCSGVSCVVSRDVLCHVMCCITSFCVVSLHVV